jgi:hypothetical protein
LTDKLSLQVRNCLVVLAVLARISLFSETSSLRLFPSGTAIQRRIAGEIAFFRHADTMKNAVGLLKKAPPSFGTRHGEAAC